MDAAFERLLTDEATITRPQVELDGEGGPKTPRYEDTGTTVRVRIVAAGTASEDDLLGRTEDVTHLVYAEVADVRPSDRLVTRPGATTLSEDAGAGATVLAVACTSGFLDGQRIEVGAGDCADEVTVVSVGEGELTVSPGLAEGHVEGEAVCVLQRYEVMAVEDEAGAAHHLRMAVRRV